MSNFDDYSFVTKAFKLGIYDYILKIDFEPTAFSKLLKKAVVDIYESKKHKQETELHQFVQTAQKSYYGS